MEIRVAASVVASTAKRYYRPDIRKVSILCREALVVTNISYTDIFFHRMPLPVSLPSSYPSALSRLTDLLS